MSHTVDVRPFCVGAMFSDRVDLGVIARLVLGKFLGVFGGANGPPLARWCRRTSGYAAVALRWMMIDTAPGPR